MKNSADLYSKAFSINVALPALIALFSYFVIEWTQGKGEIIFGALALCALIVVVVLIAMFILNFSLINRYWHNVNGEKLSLKMKVFILVIGFIPFAHFILLISMASSLQSLEHEE